MNLNYVNVITCELFMTFIALLSTVSVSFEIRSAGDALEYLSHFGYMNELKQSTDVDIDEAREAVREFQDFTNLNPNGKLNRRTLNEMNKPRCGNRDLRVETGDEVGIEWSGRDARRRRRKRYDSPGLRWHKRTLTYRVTEFANSSLNPKTLQKEIDIAFKYWEREANLTFKKIWDGTPDIEIKFVRGDHGDEESFDGPSKTLAHAFYPARGDIHFDDEEKWTANARHGHNLRTVAVHEIGHALGLGHSKEKRSVMYLMYQGFKEKLELHPSDTNAIQELYGPKISKYSLKTHNEVLKYSPKYLKLEGMISNSEAVDLCLNSSIDAISALADGFVYIFKKDYYYRMEMGAPIDYSEYPKRINETFRGLPANLDTVLTISNGKTYFFKGRLYWRSTGTKMDTGYPKKIAQNFLGIPNNLDASFVWSWNNMVYFFKKHRYWRYNFDTPTKRAIPVHKNTKSTPLQRKRKGRHNVEIIQGYPKRILTNWPGIPDGIEDGFRAPNGRTYIFKGGEYWQFHDPDSKVEAESYPRSSAEWWFGCSDFVPDARKIRHVRRRKPYNYL